MSEPINSGFPFSGMEDSEELDVSAIFGGGAPTDDVNPFDLPAARTETPAVWGRRPGCPWRCLRALSRRSRRTGGTI